MTAAVRSSASPPTSFAGVAEIDVDSVTKRFAVGRSDHLVAVDDVSLTIDQTSAVGIVGESGSGKSTLSRMLVGLERPSNGTIRLNGANVAAMSAADLHEFRRLVQFVAQDTSSSFDPRRTLGDAVRTPAQRLGGLNRAEADVRMAETLELLGLSVAMADRRPHEVSGGQRQRFSLARALVVQPKVLVCDEVVSALDVSVQGSILNFLRDYCREHRAGLVFVSHGLPATAFVSEELIVMHRGRVVERGPVETLLADPSHPYTHQLLMAHRERPDGSAATPPVDDETAACRFLPWCPRGTERCHGETPLLRTIRGTSAACHHPLEAPERV